MSCEGLNNTSAATHGLRGEPWLQGISINHFIFKNFLFLYTVNAICLRSHTKLSGQTLLSCITFKTADIAQSTDDAQYVCNGGV